MLALANAVRSLLPIRKRATPTNTAADAPPPQATLGEKEQRSAVPAWSNALAPAANILPAPSTPTGATCGIRVPELSVCRGVNDPLTADEINQRLAAIDANVARQLELQLHGGQYGGLARLAHELVVRERQRPRLCQELVSLQKKKRPTEARVELAKRGFVTHSFVKKSLANRSVDAGDLGAFVQQLTKIPDLPHSPCACLKKNIIACWRELADKINQISAALTQPAWAHVEGLAQTVDDFALFLDGCRQIYSDLRAPIVDYDSFRYANRVSIALRRTRVLATTPASNAALDILDSFADKKDLWVDVEKRLAQVPQLRRYLKDVFQVEWEDPIITMPRLLAKNPHFLDDEVEDLILAWLNNPTLHTSQEAQYWRRENEAIMACSAVRHDLFVGSIATAGDADALVRRGITHVVTCFGEPFFPGQFNYLKVQVSDNAAEPLMAYFDAVCRFVATARDSGGAVLIHCQKGRSRSAALCAAVLMHFEHLSSEEALAQVKKARSIACPNAGFVRQLAAWGEYKRGPAPMTVNPAAAAPPSEPDLFALAPTCPEDDPGAPAAS